jgi:hypothetical protein
MSDVYGSVVLGGEERNVEYLGLFVAWLTCNNLLSVVTERSNGRAISRVRMHDLTGADFLATVLDGELRADQLSDEGARFTEHFLLGGGYQQAYEACSYEGDNEWIRYDEVSPAVTAEFRRWREPAKPLAKIIKFPGLR